MSPNVPDPGLEARARADERLRIHEEMTRLQGRLERVQSLTTLVLTFGNDPTERALALKYKEIIDGEPA